MKKLILPVFFLVAVFSASAQVSEEAFFRLCATGTLEDVQRAVAAGANVNAWGEIKDADGLISYYTCLMIACKNENVAIVDFLLDNGAKPDSHSKEYPIHYVTAWQRNDLETTKRIIQKLQSKGAEIDARTTSGLTPLLLCAVDPKKSDLGLLFLELGADVNVRDANASTPLIVALNTGIPDNPDDSTRWHQFLDKLVSSGANPNAKNLAGDTAFSILKKYDRKQSNEATYYSWYWKIQDNYYNAGGL
jgi:ankyrin repeat protein